MKRREFITLIGGAAAWPLGVRAQQSKKPTIGVLVVGNPEPFWSGFRDALSALGYVEGQCQRGYGTRDPAFVGGTYGAAPVEDGLAAIVVPLLDRTRVHGSINILWIKAAFKIEEFVARHLSDLKAAASEIVVSLQEPRKERQAR